MRDLRNGSIVRNVSKESARHLWRYAIAESEKNNKQINSIHWQNDLAVLKVYNRSGRVRYNLAQLDKEDTTHYYYGVTQEGLHGEWKTVVEKSQSVSSRKQQQAATAQ